MCVVFFYGTPCIHQGRNIYTYLVCVCVCVSVCVCVCVLQAWIPVRYPRHFVADRLHNVVYGSSSWRHHVLSG